MSVRLDAYLALEREMLVLDDAADPIADRLRDLMDPLWYGLTNEEHALLDARRITALADLHPIRLPESRDLVRPPGTPSAPSLPIRNRAVGIELVLVAA